MMEQKFLDEYRYLGNRAYLDCSTVGLQPERSLKAARTFLDDFAHHFGSSPEGGNRAQRMLCRQRLAELTGAEAEDIFFTENTTQGNNLLAACYPLKEGDEVIVGNGDFTSLWMPWAHRQADGIKLIWVDNRNGVVDAEDFIRKITDRTRVIAVSWVQSDSGYTTNLARLGAVCRARNILLTVDAIQGMGRLPMDVKAMNVDVLASSSFKGMLGVMGAGFCYCRREVMEQITPPVCSGNIRLDSVDFTPGFQHQNIPVFADRAARMETGTRNDYGYRVMSESAGLLLEIGVDRIAAHIRQLERYYRSCLMQANLDIRILGAPEEESWSGSISFLYPENCREKLKQELERREISVAVRQYLRVSLHYYNKREHIDRLMSVLTDILPQK